MDVDDYLVDVDVDHFWKEEEECQLFSPIPEQLVFSFKTEQDDNGPNSTKIQNFSHQVVYQQGENVKKRGRDEDFSQNEAFNKKARHSHLTFPLPPVERNFLPEDPYSKAQVKYEEPFDTSTMDSIQHYSSEKVASINWEEIDWGCSSPLTLNPAPHPQLHKDIKILQLESPKAGSSRRDVAGGTEDLFRKPLWHAEKEGKALVVHKPWYSHGPFILLVICHALDIMEDQKLKQQEMEISSAVGILRHHLYQNILQNQVIIKEMVVNAVAEGERMDLRNFLHKKKLKKEDGEIGMQGPYFKAPSSSSVTLAAPQFNPSVRLNYVPRHQSIPNEGTKLEKVHLRKCVLRSSFQRRMFFLESEVELKLLDFGLSVEDVSSFAALWTNYEKELWKLEMDQKISPEQKSVQAHSLLENYIEGEKNALGNLIDSYKRKHKNVEWREVDTKPRDENSVIISVHDLMLEKYGKLEEILQERLEGSATGNIDLRFVDWEMVAKDMGELTSSRSEMTADSCQRYFKIGLGDLYTHSPILPEQVKVLRKVVAAATNRGVIDWSLVFQVIQRSYGFSPMAVFSTWRNRRDEEWKRRKKFASKREKIMQKVWECKGNITKAITELEPKYGQLSYNLILNQWKIWNPNYTKGPFSLHEDALLIVSFEMLDFRVTEGNFKNISALLPWRYCSSWRNRAESLFRDPSTPFTMEEDRKLLILGHLVGNNWSEFQRFFENKTRKRLCLRFQYLQRKLETMDLKEYHILYSRRNWKSNPFTPRLQQVAKLFRQIISVKFGLPITMDGFKIPKSKISQREEFLSKFRVNEPSEQDLFQYLFTFDLKVLTTAFKNLVTFLFTVNQSGSNGSENMSSSVIHPAVCDRRKFDLRDPMSVASALHLRGMCLQPQETIKELSDFEKQIYSFYRMFCGRYRTKKNAYRSGIPNVKELVGIPQLRNILVVPKKIQLALTKKGNVDACKMEPGTSIGQPYGLMEEGASSMWEEYKKRVNRKGPRGQMKKTLVKQYRVAAANSRWKKYKETHQNISKSND